MDRKECYRKFLDAWGDKAQINMCIEEMAELTKELCKLKRVAVSKYKTEEVIKNIQEELADVLNMVDQLKLIFGEDEVERIRDEKIERTLKRLQDR